MANTKPRMKKLVTPENKLNLIYLALTLQNIESMLSEAQDEVSQLAKELKDYLGDNKNLPLL